ncbi:MAG TPA: DsbA family protein [Alphaproteobacteria bacterium]|nr:DsbA family protein [Alphaproteobacteria bacterium]HOO50085.1 DsbA family protein [Alphaproteobacteria bacterium]
MLENKGSSKIVIVLAIAVIAAAVYFFMNEMKDFPPSPDANPSVVDLKNQALQAEAEETAEEEATSDQNTLVEQVDVITNDAPESSAPVVVETKTLPIPDVNYPVAVDTTDDPAIAAMMGDRVLGSDDAPIKVVEYSSLTCGHCAAFHTVDLEKIKEAYIDTGKVQFIFKEYPLNQPAVIGSAVLRCMPEDRFVPFMSLLFEKQQDWAYSGDYQDKLIQYAKLAGMSEDEISACIQNTDLQKRIIADMKLAGEAYQIASTPTFIVNGGEKVIVGHQPYEFFVSTFDTLLGGETAE